MLKPAWYGSTILTCVLLVTGLPRFSIATEMNKPRKVPGIQTECNYISEADLAGKRAPEFSAFPATTIPGLSPAPVDLQSHPKASRYRTVLREGAAQGPNFAGHLTIVGWGCGSSCLAWAIVDAKSGKVYWPPTEITTMSTVHVLVPDVIPDCTALRFKLDSNLLMLLGAPNEDDSREGILFYRWTGTTLVSVQAYRVDREWCK